MLTTRDSLFDGAVVLEQPARGYRFNVDAVILAEFASVRRARAAFDLGSGVGAVAFSLLHLGGAAHVTLVERDAEAARLARANAIANGREEMATVIEGDVAEIEGRADLVVCNPPYVPPGRGRTPADDRAAAKQGALGVFLDAARRLSGRRARACFIYPAIELVTLVTELRRRGLEPKRLQLVHAKPGRKAHVALVECVLGKPGGLVVEPPRFLA